MKRTKISAIYADAPAFTEEELTVCGWVRTVVCSIQQDFFIIPYNMNYKIFIYQRKNFGKIPFNNI